MERLIKYIELVLSSGQSIEVFCGFKNRTIAYHDILTVVYNNAGQGIPLGTGNVISVFDELYHTMCGVLNNIKESVVDFNFDHVRGMGYYYNLKYADSDIERSLLSGKHFFLYGGNSGFEKEYICTVYNYQGVINLEISSLFKDKYKDLFPDESEADYNIRYQANFNSWLENEYKIINRIILPKSVCMEIKSSCEVVLRGLEDFKW